METLFTLEHFFSATESGTTESHPKRRGSSGTSAERKYSGRAKNSSAESGKVDQTNVSDEDTDPDDYAENELTLTNIASGQMLTGGICNDFFGDTEVGDLEIETFVSSATTSKGQVHHMFSRFLNQLIFFTNFSLFCSSIEIINADIKTLPRIIPTF